MQYTWVFALSFFVAFVCAFGIGANDGKMLLRLLEYDSHSAVTKNQVVYAVANSFGTSGNTALGLCTP